MFYLTYVHQHRLREFSLAMPLRDIFLLWENGQRIGAFYLTSRQQ